LDPIVERDQWLEGIEENLVAREIISQGGPTIQTTVSLGGLHVSIRRIEGQKEGYSKSSMHAPAN